MSDEELHAAVLAALAPSGVRERVRVAVGGGYTALQVWERLPEQARAALMPPDTDPTVGSRLAVDRVQRSLRALVVAGRVRHRRVGMTMVFNTKGPRDVLVDVFRKV